MLRKGAITIDGLSDIDWSEPVFVSTDKLVKGYKHANKNAERYTTVQSEGIAETLRKVCPSAKKTKSTEMHGSTRKRGYKLPHVCVARQDFERHLGANIDWE